MASEAQRLIGISLTKIAQSRTNRAGVSLHKNLLVATVLQKARFIFMEEAYNMVHYQNVPLTTSVPPIMPISYQQTINNDEQEDLVAVTAEEVGIEPTPNPGNAEETNNLDFLQPTCEKFNKENQPPNNELTYLDLDKSQSSNLNSNVLIRDRVNISSSCLKRRRAVSDWETEEAVQSILPKKSKCEEDDSVFLDDATILSETVSKEVELKKEEDKIEENTNSMGGSAMEIDRITSLVSIFSFGVGGEQKLTRSMSTPDLCSSQAKDPGNDVLQQRQFLAMTV